MKNKNKLIFTLFTSVCSLLMASISVSFAWFKRNYNQVEMNVDGSVLEQYFDKRDFDASDDTIGTSENNPFVITTFRHYENLVKLHHASFEDSNGDIVSFSSQHYYFEIGKQFEEGGDFLVYEFSDTGAQTGNKCKELNLNALDVLEPIGSEDYPFVSTINGHNITVKNFTVSSEADSDNSYYDFGIFGYVGNRDDGNSGNISNIYFSDFKLDASELNASNADERDYHNAHKTNSFIGLLCGHVYDVNSFSNVYINNASMKGGTSNYASVNNYGYFGYVEVDNEGSVAGNGNNYTFDLNSSAIYEYFQDHYNEEEFTFDENGDDYTLANTIMRVRNTEYDNTINSSNNTKFSAGVTKENANYRLIGTYSNGSSNVNATRNYSISTLGYHGANVNKETYKYKTYYRNSGEYLIPSEDATVTTYPIEEQSISGNYYYYNKAEKKWQYYYSNNKFNTYTLNLTIPSVSLENLRHTGLFNAARNDEPEYNVSLVIDNMEIDCVQNGTNPEDLNYTINYTYTNKQANVTFNFDNLTINNLAGGTHYIAFCASVKTSYLGIINEYSSAYYGTSTNNVITPESFDLKTGNKVNDVINVDKILTLSTKRLVQNNENKIGDMIDYIPELFIGEENILSDLYGKEVYEDNTTSNEYVVITPKTSSFYYEYGEAFANVIDRQVIRDSVGSVFIGDDPDIVASGYSSKSIDIVGGGITFGETYLNLAGEGTNSNITKTPAIGDDFYATKYCANSLVLYLKKTPGNNLGTIDVKYTTLGALFNITLKVPALKKGNSTFVSFDSLNNLDPTGSSEYTHNDGGTTRNIAIKKITPIQAQAASLCAIDANNKVVAIYNADGTLKSGGNENTIDKYVIAVGVQNQSRFLSRIINNTRITSIHFEYKAEEGYCSQLGRIDFRSADEVIPEDLTTSIFTMYFTVPSDPTKKFKIVANYDSGTQTYNINFYTNYETNIKVYLYINDYKVAVNGVEVLNSKGVASPVISPSSNESVFEL